MRKVILGGVVYYSNKPSRAERDAAAAQEADRSHPLISGNLKKASENQLLSMIERGRGGMRAALAKQELEARRKRKEIEDIQAANRLKALEDEIKEAEDR